jgi:transposase InsO family protein
LRHINSKGLAAWMRWYDRQRPHQSLDYQNPNQVYTEGQEPISLVV